MPVFVINFFFAIEYFLVFEIWILNEELISTLDQVME